MNSPWELMWGGLLSGNLCIPFNPGSLAWHSVPPSAPFHPQLPQIRLEREDFRAGAGSKAQLHHRPCVPLSTSSIPRVFTSLGIMIPTFQNFCEAQLRQESLQMCAIALTPLGCSTSQDTCCPRRCPHLSLPWPQHTLFSSLSLTGIPHPLAQVLTTCPA